MGLVLTPNLVLTPSATFQPHWPIILWDSHVAFDNITSSSANASYPVTNLANSATHLRWLSASTSEQTVTVALATTVQVNAIGIARHNLGSTQCMVAIEGLSADEGATWETIVEGFYLGTDDPALILFTSQNLASIRLKLTPNGTAPTIAVLYIGKALWVQNGLKPGFTPIVDGLDVEKLNGISEGGERLGDPIVTRQTLSTQAQFSMMDRDWYRENMRDFVHAANRGRAFFIAALPQWYAREVGFCWFPEGFAGRPSMDDPVGRTSLQLQMTGIAS